MTIDIDFKKIPLDDPLCYNQFSIGNTACIHQVSKYGMTNFFKRLKPENFNDLVAGIALYRPGPLKSGIAQTYIERKNGEEYKVIPKIAGITKDTFGVMVFQEQVMQIAVDVAGFTSEESDKLRKMIAKSKGKKEIEKFKDDFINGCKKYSDFDGEKLWDEIVEFGSYGFNKAHSVEYALISYWGMYLKCYYPKEFMLSVLAFSEGDELRESVEEAKRLNFKIQTPKTRISKATQWVEKDSVLYAPYTSIKNMGEKEAIKAEKFRNRGFFPTISSNTLLNKAGCFSDEYDPDLFEFEPSDFKEAKPYDIEYPNLYSIAPDLFSCDIDDVLKGNLSGEIDKNLYLIRKKKIKKYYSNCTQCDLNKNDLLPTQKGKYNAFIVGGSPLKSKDKIVLFKELKEYGLGKRDLNIASIVKCKGVPNKAQIGICSQKLFGEMRSCSCRLVLAVGDVAKNVFLRNKKMESGECRWVEKRKCWVVFSSEMDGKNFSNGIEKFIKIFEKLL